ncbi:hypothetical protein BJY00DRAFT_317004 [Aspergillus carlsbadensis]|nr:hypothetical protein BJY00DRAFT_317004 [Aspergillus carlsbadensis]
MPSPSPCLVVPPLVQANGYGRFFPDSAEDFAFAHFRKNCLSRKSEARAHKAGYAKARDSLPESDRKAYAEWNSALYKEVKKYVEFAPCTRFRDPRRVPLFTQYATWLNFVENCGDVRHPVKNPTFLNSTASKILNLDYIHLVNPELTIVSFVNMSPPPRTEIFIPAILQRSDGRFDVDMAEKYGYHDFNYANVFDRFIDCCVFFKEGFTVLPRELGDPKQMGLVGECIRAINREVKYYCRTTTRGLQSEARTDLFSRYAMCLNFLENVYGRRMPVDDDVVQGEDKDQDEEEEEEEDENVKRK